MKRVPQLDVLRAVAVLLVLCRHFVPVRFLATCGWIGVDLFFVLSGFLVSGLLFAPLRNGTVPSIKQFLIRRGFKIYPAYFFFLLVSFLIGYKRSTALYIHQLLFIQNYAGGAWYHTWSLSVEEHFYFVIPVLLLILSRLNRLHWIPRITVTLLVCCLISRTFFSAGSFENALLLSHNRFDALFCGVCLSYLFHFRESVFVRLGSSRLALCGVLMILPTTFIPVEAPYIYTIGLTLNALGFSLVLAWSLRQSWMQSKLVEQIGRSSYSIYLWQFLPEPFLPVAGVVRFLAGMIAPIALGITMGQIVEFPALAIRDRLFPDSTRRSGEPIPVRALAATPE